MTQSKNQTRDSILLPTLLFSALLSTPCALSAQPAAQPAPPPPPVSGQAMPQPPMGRGMGAPRGEARPGREMRGDNPGGGDRGMHAGAPLGPPGMWWKNPDTIQKLTLTADQQKKMGDIFQRSRVQLIDLDANVKKQSVILEPMLDANPPDTNKVLAQIDHVASARAELEKANARMLLGIRGVLTADQWTKLQADRREGHHTPFDSREGHKGPFAAPPAGMPHGNR